MVKRVMRRLGAVTPRRAMTIVVAVSSVVATGVASSANAVEPAPSRPVLPNSAEIATDQAGNWSIVGAAPENVLTQAKPDADPVQTATDVVADYADGLGIADPGSAFTAQPVRELGDGGTVVRFDQNVSGIPVFASGVAVRLTPDNEALSVSSTIVADERSAGMDLAPTIDQAAAVDLGRTGIDPEGGVDPSQLAASTPEMMIYDPDLIGGDPNAQRFSGPRLVWSMRFSNADDSVRQRVLVDAVEPTVVLSFSENPHGINRLVCDFQNTPSPQACRGEGESPIYGRDEMNRGYVMIGETYNYFKNTFNRDSFDNRGAQLVFVTRFCPNATYCPYNNAFWNGSLLVFGQGFANADDIIAHEFTHAVTEHEANLMYYAESGAINESMSDVFGEIIDQTYNYLGTDNGSNKWLLGEDLGSPGRSLKNPPSLGDPDRLLSPQYHLSADDHYGVHTNSGVNNKAMWLMAQGGSFNGQTVAGLGNTKTAAIYYEALTSILTPGSDYIDLYWGLQRACKNLIGQRGINAGDCTMVERAVTATEMNKARARRFTTTRNCSTGNRTEVFKDDAESGFGKWTASNSAGRWRVTTRASQSGKHSLFAPDPGGSSQTGPSYTTWMRSKSRIKIPWTGTSYLWFDHSYNLEEDNDGGVVEWSVDGKSWKDLGGLAEANGYNGSVGRSVKNPIAGRRAFTGESRGFEQTRISLAKLRGRRIFIRFRIGADPTFGTDGWHIDDVTVYNCSSTVAQFRSGYQPITPKRLIDTRSSKGLVKARGMRPAGTVLKFNARKLGIYKRGHTPTALNLTITSVGNTAPGHVTAYPCGKRPKTSTLNAMERGAIVVNTATIPISAQGEICIYNHARTNLIVDVAGYETSAKGNKPPTRYQAMTPRRVVDTRNGKGLIKVRGRRRAGSTLKIDVSNLGIFKANTTPLALDLTFTGVNNSGVGHVTAYPCGKRPNTSLLNAYKPGQVVSNTATVPVSGGDQICVYNATETDLLIDITGYYSSTQGPVLSRYRPVTPQRVVDTRNSNGLYKIRGIRPAGSTLKINLNKLGIQQSGHKPTAYDLTFTMILNQAPGHVTAYPCGKRPTASVINATTSKMVIANTATIPVSANGDICIYTHARTHLAVDVTGYHFK